MSRKERSGLKTYAMCKLCLPTYIRCDSVGVSYRIKGIIVLAIGFARIEYISRSKGQNACDKSAYYSHQKIRCSRIGKTFCRRSKTHHNYHEILLPVSLEAEHVSAKKLWNLVEGAESRINSQVAIKVVLALPNDGVISLEDKIKMSREFASSVFLSELLGVQLDIHYSQIDGGNWFAILLVTTRHFKKEVGLSLGEKARDFMKLNFSGRNIQENQIGVKWAKFQEEYFKRSDIPLSVNVSYTHPQNRVGPKRLRSDSKEAFEHWLEIQKQSKVLGD